MRTFVSNSHVILLVRLLKGVKVLFEGLDNFLIELLSEGAFVKKVSFTFEIFKAILGLDIILSLI